MPSTFDVLAAEELVPAIVETFGDRDGLGDYVPVSILLNRSQQPFLWPQAVVYGLKVQRVEENGDLVERETLEISGPTATLITGVMPLPETTQITVPKYGETPFHPFPDGCEYDVVTTTLTLIRVPLVDLNSFRQQRAG